LLIAGLCPPLNLPAESITLPRMQKESR
jgi:hypothetical protein